MKPRRTHSSTQVFRLAGGTEDNDLWVTIRHREGEGPVMCSVWEPTAEERARIAAGENIRLSVLGGQPPVAIDVTAESLGRPPDAGTHP